MKLYYTLQSSYTTKNLSWDKNYLLFFPWNKIYREIILGQEISENDGFHNACCLQNVRTNSDCLKEIKYLINNKFHRTIVI